jgi:hypothetical protein
LGNQADPWQIAIDWLSAKNGRNAGKEGQAKNVCLCMISQANINNLYCIYTLNRLAKYLKKENNTKQYNKTKVTQ